MSWPTRPRTARTLALGALALTSALSLAGCGSGFSEPTAPAPSGSGSASTGAGGGLTSSEDALTVLIGSSGDAETEAVTAAVDEWAGTSGTGAEVTVASDLPQQLSQGFASGDPADVFYLSTDAIAGYAANGSLLAYGDQLSNREDYFPTLVEGFTVDGRFYCAPKDFSTLSLVIDTQAWEEAGLTDADVPTDWEGLRRVAGELTTGDRVGLALSPEYARVGAFMAQAGGALTDPEGTRATADSPENAAGLQYVKELLTSGDAAFSSELGAGWGGEAFGSGKAAMTVEGNWIAGAMSADYPDKEYRVAELPAGPAGPGTLQFSNCWGIAADSPNQQAALELVEQLTSTEQQLAFADAFGVMPSVQSAADTWKQENPDSAPFLDAADYAVGVPNADGATDVIADFNARLEQLEGTEPAEILASTQEDLDAVLQ